MKITINKSPQQGSMLIVSILGCTILGILLAGYLSLIGTQHRSVVRSDAWHKAMITAESGVEEALAHLNSGATVDKLAVNSWEAYGGGVYRKTNVLEDGYSIVTIKIPPAVTGPDPVIVSSAHVRGPVSGPELIRTVQVQTRQKPIILTPGAMVSLSTIDFNGQGVHIDSFISSDTNYSTGGLYDPAKARDRADVVTITSATNAIQLGNATVKGVVRTGAAGVVKVGANGTVGDAAWVAAGQQGIQAGHFADDVNVTIPAASLPPNFSGTPASPGSYVVNGTTYKYQLNPSAPWQVRELDGSLYVGGGDVVLYVSDRIRIGSGAQIRIATNSTLTLYMGGAAATISGSGVVNESGRAKSFTYYGLPANTSIDLGANASFVGTIYAPQATFTLGGGGRNTYDFIGRCVVQAITMNGHFNFHYDEMLEKIVAITGYVPISWAEL